MKVLFIFGGLEFVLMANTAHDQSNTRIYAGESMKQTTKTEIQSMHNNIFDSLRAVRKRERERRKTAEELIQLVVVFTTNPLNKCFFIIHFRTEM